MPRFPAAPGREFWRFLPVECGITGAIAVVGFVYRAYHASMGLRGTSGAARRHVWLVIVPVVLAAGVALALSLLSNPRYRATADVSIVATDDGVERVVATELVVASGSELVAEVRAVVGDEPELSVDAAGSADVLEFTASSTNADTAAAAANGYADVYVAQTSNTEVVDRAVAPSDPYEPDVARTVLMAALAGLVIGVVAALLVAWRDATIRSEGQLAKITGAPNLVTIPLGEVRPAGVAVLRDPISIESESYRTLRTALDFAAHDRPFTVLLVSSPRPDDGKSSVAANLAAVVALSGRKVVLVDGDLRRPQVHRLFDISNDRGLSSVVTREAPLQQCVQRLDRERNLALLTAGPSPPDPAELLAHERLRLTLEALAGPADLVVIDAPPVLPVADSIILAQAADATLLVATAGFSDRREWVDTLGRLRDVDADVIGTVLLCTDSRVYAMPSHSDAPSATPVHRPVTEASPRSETDSDVHGRMGDTDAIVVDEDPRDEDPRDGVPVEEVPVGSGGVASNPSGSVLDASAWGRSLDSDELVWRDSSGGGTDDRLGGDDELDSGAVNDDGGHSQHVIDGVPPAN